MDGEGHERVGGQGEGRRFGGGSYGSGPGTLLWELLTSERYKDSVLGANAMVLGSQRPSMEVILLAAGMSHVTTAEYGTIKATHPDMTWVHPTELNQAAESVIGKYDVIASFSSTEHSGLGRYGDPLNPSGDLMSLAQISCLLKPGGLLFFGVPTNIGQDRLQFNAHRIYGEKRLKLMFMQFRVVGVAPTHSQGMNRNHQPWFVLQNKRGCA